MSPYYIIKTGEETGTHLFPIMPPDWAHGSESPSSKRDWEGRAAAPDEYLNKMLMLPEICQCGPRYRPPCFVPARPPRHLSSA